MIDAIGAIQRFIGATEKLGIDYYIGGSIASIVYGKARTTRDVGFVLTIRPEQATLLVQSLESEFYIDLNAIHRSIAKASLRFSR